MDPKVFRGRFLRREGGRDDDLYFEQLRPVQREPRRWDESRLPLNFFLAPDELNERWRLWIAYHVPPGRDPEPSLDLWTSVHPQYKDPLLQWGCTLAEMHCENPLNAEFVGKVCVDGSPELLERIKTMSWIDQHEQDIDWKLWQGVYDGESLVVSDTVDEDRMTGIRAAVAASEVCPLVVWLNRAPPPDGSPLIEVFPRQHSPTISPEMWLGRFLRDLLAKEEPPDIAFRTAVVEAGFPPGSLCLRNAASPWHSQIANKRRPDVTPHVKEHRRLINEAVGELLLETSDVRALIVVSMVEDEAASDALTSPDWLNESNVERRTLGWADDTSDDDATAADHHLAELCKQMRAEKLPRFLAAVNRLPVRVCWFRHAAQRVVSGASGEERLGLPTLTAGCLDHYLRRLAAIPPGALGRVGLFMDLRVVCDPSSRGDVTARVEQIAKSLRAGGKQHVRIEAWACAPPPPPQLAPPPPPTPRRWHQRILGLLGRRPA